MSLIDDLNKKLEKNDTTGNEERLDINFGSNNYKSYIYEHFLKTKYAIQEKATASTESIITEISNMNFNTAKITKEEERKKNQIIIVASDDYNKTLDLSIKNRIFKQFEFYVLLLINGTVTSKTIEMIKQTYGTKVQNTKVQEKRWNILFGKWQWPVDFDKDPLGFSQTQYLEQYHSMEKNDKSTKDYMLAKWKGDIPLTRFYWREKPLKEMLAEKENFDYMKIELNRKETDYDALVIAYLKTAYIDREFVQITDILKKKIEKMKLPLFNSTKMIDVIDEQLKIKTAAKIKFKTSNTDYTEIKINDLKIVKLKKNELQQYQYLFDPEKLSNFNENYDDKEWVKVLDFYGYPLDSNSQNQIRTKYDTGYDKDIIEIQKGFSQRVFDKSITISDKHIYGKDNDDEYKTYFGDLQNFHILFKNLCIVWTTTLKKFFFDTRSVLELFFPKVGTGQFEFDSMKQMVVYFYKNVEKK